MSHPVATREYGNESEPKSPREKAISRKMKAFGSEYNRKSIKRMMKKGKDYQLKHF